MSNTKTVTLPVDGAWRPVNPNSPSARKDGQTAEFTARRCRFVVVTAGGTLMHGPWQERREAELFAHSTGSLPSDSGEVLSAQVLEVAGYWHLKGFGRIF